MVKRIVREFCGEIPYSNPKRIEKLTSFLDLRSSLILIMTLKSALKLKEVDLSPNSCLKAYMIDFIKDARDLGIKDQQKIISHIISPEIDGITKEQELMNILERKIIENQVEESLLKGDEEIFKERFNLADVVKDENKKTLNTSLHDKRRGFIEKIEDDLDRKARHIPANFYGEFLQCIPMPGN